MKWILGLFSLAFFFAACDNELVVTDKWKDIPVVWGLLSKSDTAHYIRVEKAYLDPTTSALDIAHIPDSLYYENAVVQLKRISSGQIFTLDRVDGDAEGYPREGGVFATTPNYLYKIKANEINLVVGETYQFILQRNDHTAPVTAQTIILPKPVLRSPTTGALIGFKPKSDFTFKWNPIDDAGIYDVHVNFHYSERSPATGNLYQPLSFDWVVVRNLDKSEYVVNGSEFFNSIKANLKVTTSDTTRKFDSLDIVVWCAGKELRDFIKINQANQGITATQDIPGYSNISEGIGIFTSRNYARYTGFQLTTQSLDTLKKGVITKVLNFK